MQQLSDHVKEQTIHEQSEKKHSEILNELHGLQQVVVELEEKIDKVRRYLFWMRAMSILKIVLIVVPIVFGLWYLSPYLSQAKSSLDTYAELLGIDTKKSNQNADSETASDPSIDKIQKLLEIYGK